MKRIDANLKCPSCSGELRPSLLACEPCDLKIEGQFRLNEFARLDSEQLQFLRLFIQAEGRIRDLEKSLQLSYPTVKSKIASLKAALKDQPVICDTYRPEEELLQ